MAANMRLSPINDKDGALRREADRIAASLPSLLAAANHAASTLTQGMHGRRKPGSGEAFWQYRRFTASDDASSIDWRKSARANHLYVRENEWEAAHTIWIWPDLSRSMTVHSNMAQHTKAERALVIGLALGTLLADAGELTGAYGAGRPPGFLHKSITKMAENFLEQATASPQDRTSLPPSAVNEKPFSSAVFLSDFLNPPDKLEERLTQIAGTGLRGHLVQILDPAEESLPFSGRVEFTDPESDDVLTIGRAQDLRSAYQERLQNHRAAIRALAMRMGWSFTLHHTDEPPDNALLALYNLLADQRD